MIRRLDRTLNNRRRVAQKVQEQIQNKELPNISEAMREIGYKKSTVNSKTTEVVKSSEFQEEMKSFTAQLKSLRQKALIHYGKTLEKASNRDNIEAIKVFTDKINLSEGVQEDKVITVKWE